jgi:hypothetical protein
MMARDATVNIQTETDALEYWENCSLRLDDIQPFEIAIYFFWWDGGAGVKCGSCLLHSIIFSRSLYEKNQ